jgi:TolC family type I secretion outer membrane protein
MNVIFGKADTFGFWVYNRVLMTSTQRLVFIGAVLAFGISQAPADIPAVREEVHQWQLSDVIKIALESNPDLKSAEANYEATSKTVMEAISGYLPQLNLSAGINQTNLPSPSAGASSQVGIKLTYSSAIFSLSQTLFDFGKVLSQINANRAQTDSAEQQSLVVKYAVQVAVERAFYNVIANQKLLEAAKRSEDQFQETYRRTSVLVSSGTKPSFDLTQAKVQLAKAKLGEINAQNFVDLSRIALINLMGISDDVAFELKEPEKYNSPPSSSMDLKDLQNKALQFRPEMKSSEFAVKQARFQLHGVMTQYLPTLSFLGYYGTYQPNYPVEIRTAYSAGLGLTWNLFDGLNTTSRVGELSYRLDQQESLQDREKDSIFAEVASDYKELIRSESQLEVADDALASARENSQLANKRYQASVATILELLVAESSLIESEGAAIQAKYQRQIALAQLRKAVNAPLTTTPSVTQ